MAHLLNLVAQDVSDGVITEHVKNVAKYFRNDNAAKAWLQACEPAVPKAPMPGETRWNGVADLLEWYIKFAPPHITVTDWPYFLLHRFWSQLVTILQSNRGDRDVLRVVENLGIKKNAEDLLVVCYFHPTCISVKLSVAQVTKEIAVSLDVMQRDDCNIAQAADVWVSLIKSAVIQSNEKAKAAVKDRSAVVLQSGSFAANLLDPRYLGKNLSSAEKQAGLRFLLQEATLRFPASADVVGAALTKFLADGLPTPCTRGTMQGQGGGVDQRCMEG